jgi:hypothetical protein
LVLGAHYVRNGNVMTATADEGATEVENASGKKQKLRGKPRVYLSPSDHHMEENQHEAVPEGSRYCVLI